MSLAGWRAQQVLVFTKRLSGGSEGLWGALARLDFAHDLADSAGLPPPRVYGGYQATPGRQLGCASTRLYVIASGAAFLGDLV